MISAPCNFGTFLEEAIRDRLIVALHNAAIRCKHLAAGPGPGPDLRKALQPSVGGGSSAMSKKGCSNDAAGSTGATGNVNWQREACSTRLVAAVAFSASCSRRVLFLWRCPPR
ncbi:uncharacterized protein [Dermacentor albipictus]|uniref:uncharacterized protein isoform X2 n=1 Tax=Dermacentor albipictus TaxID=60249 RepID=UPI0038FCDAFF